MYWPFFNMRSNFLIGHCFTCPDQNFLPLTWEYDYAKTPSQIGIDHTKSSGITTPWYLVPLAHDPHYYPENCRISTHWIFIWEMDRKIWVGSNHLSFTLRLCCHAKTILWNLNKHIFSIFFFKDQESEILKNLIFLIVALSKKHKIF